MNLAYLHPSVYWATSVLTVDAGAIEDDNNTGTNYAKVSSAIGRIKKEGYTIELPDINRALFGFSPNPSENTILYGLKSISGVGDDYASEIIANRPYSSLANFLEKCPSKTAQTISLIKAGAFEKFGTRSEVMKEYISIITTKRDKITLQNINMLIEYSLIPKSQISYIKLSNFNKYLKNLKVENGFLLDDRAYGFISSNFHELLGDDKFLDAKLWKKTYNNNMEGLRQWLKENEDELISKSYELDQEAVWDKYCQGTVSHWEMDTLGFYHGEHELANIELENVATLEEAEGTDYKNPCTIAGTVLGKDAIKHMVTILTREGVQILKFTADKFAKYNRTISEVINGDKVTIEQSWFKKGVLVTAKGYKRGELFQTQVVSKIVDIDKEGKVKMTKYRYGGESQ